MHVLSRRCVYGFLQARWVSLHARAAALARPEDARRWIRLGWELLLAGQPVEATMPLQRGMTLAPMMPIAPVLLLLAHGLAGDVEGAQSLLDGIGSEDLLEPLLQ
ncbi:MAG: hypothetical protein RIT45_477 [Pseudomonadota bacterium]